MENITFQKNAHDAGKTYFSNHVGTYMHTDNANVRDVVCNRAYVMEQCLSLERFDVWTRRANEKEILKSRKTQDLIKAPMTGDKRQQTHMASVVQHNFKHESHWFLRWQMVCSKQN